MKKIMVVIISIVICFIMPISVLGAVPNTLAFNQLTTSESPVLDGCIDELYGDSVFDLVAKELPLGDKNLFMSDVMPDGSISDTGTYGGTAEAIAKFANTYNTMRTIAYATYDQNNLYFAFDTTDIAPKASSNASTPWRSTNFQLCMYVNQRLAFFTVAYTGKNNAVIVNDSRNEFDVDVMKVAFSEKSQNNFVYELVIPWTAAPGLKTAEDVEDFRFGYIQTSMAEAYICTSVGEGWAQNYNKLIPVTMNYVPQASWEYNKEQKTLVLSQSIDSADDDYINQPWYEYKPEIEVIIIKNGVSSIGDNAFCKMPALKTVVLSEDVTYIGEGAFANCRNLEEINLNKNIKTIQQKTFYNCLSLKSIGNTSGIISVEDNAFYRCNSLESIQLNKAVYIGNYSFYRCSALENIVFSKAIASIGELAFGECCALKILELPSDIKEIDPDAFLNCEDIEIVYMSEKGDIDCNGTIESNDIVLLKKLLISNGTRRTAADMNEDGEINIIDFIKLKKLISE